MTMSRPICAVVKVIRGFPEDPADPVPAMVLTRKGGKQEQYLDPETAQAMGGSLVAFFEAEKIDNVWWIGKRLPDGDRGW